MKMLNHIFCSFHSPGGKHLCLLLLVVCICAITSVSLKKVPLLYFSSRLRFSLLVNHDKCSISIVCFNRSCLLHQCLRWSWHFPVCLFCWIYKNMISSHLEFVRIHQHHIADIIIKKQENEKKTREIKRKVQ
jgi:hypothetical protein